jgi:hypothetical protein
MQMNRTSSNNRAVMRVADPAIANEVAHILCAGLRRILPEQSSSLSSSKRDSSVDFSPLKSGIARRKLRHRE